MLARACQTEPPLCLQVNLSYAQSKGLLLKLRTVEALSLALVVATLVLASVVHCRPVPGRSLASLVLLVLLAVETGLYLVWLLYDSLRCAAVYVHVCLLETDCLVEPWAGSRSAEHGVA